MGILVKNKLRLNWRKFLNNDKSERKKKFPFEIWKKKNQITFRMKLVKLVEKFMYTDSKRWDSPIGYILSLFLCLGQFLLGVLKLIS